MLVAARDTSCRRVRLGRVNLPCRVVCSMGSLLEVCVRAPLPIGRQVALSLLHGRFAAGQLSAYRS
jgi:hypothetical protein